MSFHACFSPRATGSVSANRTSAASSARHAKTATSIWRTQITLAAKVSPLRDVLGEGGGPQGALRIPTDCWPWREGARDVPPLAFDHIMAQSRGWVLLWIWRPEVTHLSALDTGPSGWGMQDQERCPFECQKLVCLNHWPCPCSSAPSFCSEQVGMDMWGWLLSIMPMGSREEGDPAGLSRPTLSWQGWEEGARLLLAAGLRRPAMRVCRPCSSRCCQLSGNSSALRWKRSRSKWGWG